MSDYDIRNTDINDEILSDIFLNNNDKHVIGNAYSAEIVKNDLIKRMQEVSNNIKDIRQELLNNETIKKNLLAELRANEKIFNDLITQTQNIRLTSSVSFDDLDFKNSNISVNDQKISDLEISILEKENEINSLNNNSYVLSSREIERRKNILNHELERLKNKRVVIQGKQKKIVNSELNKYYKKIMKESIKYGVTHAVAELRLERNNVLEEKINSTEDKIHNFEDMAVSSSDKLVGSIYKAQGFISYANKVMLDKYCKLLLKKDGVLNSFRRVDEGIIDKVNSVYGSIGRKNVDIELNSGFDNSVKVNGGIQIFDPFKGTNIDYIADTLMLNKEKGVHCHTIFNGIILDNMEFNDREEIIELCNSYLFENNRKIGK